MTNGDYYVPGNAVPTVKMTLVTPFPGVPAGNDPWIRYDTKEEFNASIDTNQLTLDDREL